MAQYIPKEPLVAEIERLRKNQRLDDRHGQGVLDGLHAIERLIDTLEVKEVDINKEISRFIDTNFEKAKIGHKLSLRRTAKHFFELGMTVSNKTQKGE